jgi:hypothetical protein
MGRLVFLNLCFSVTHQVYRANRHDEKKRRDVQIKPYQKTHRFLIQISRWFAVS